MVVDVEVPSVGESVTEGVLSAWMVESGQYVAKGDTLFELETDKAMQEVPAPESGLVEHVVTAGTTVSIGTLAGRINTDARAPSGNGNTASPKKVESEQPKREKKQTGKRQDPADAEEDQKSAKPPNKIAVSSVARKIADENGIDLGTIKGSGAHGRIMREDVEAILSTKAAPVAKSRPVAAPVTSAPVSSESPESTRERMSMLRRRIAERLVNAQHTAAMLTTFNDVDMSAVMELRKQYKESFKEKHGVGLGFMSFFTKAAVEALKEYPRVNAMIDGDEIVYHHRYHVGVAVSTDRGLVVPVVRNADTLNFAEIEQRIVDYATRARDGKVEINEMQGGTFTITNGGVFGSMLSTPILNPPQSGILGMHRIEERPVARNGEVVIRPMMYLALSYDHRIVDGREAVGFLVKIKECIENPSRMLLGV